MERIIFHLDFDSFFASVEEQYDEKLRGKPFGVTATNGRTCIIASSKVAKRMGIKTGTRSYEALKICPSFILVPADFNKYLEVSKKFLNICKDYSPFIEVFSIDEVFMDVTKTANLFGGVYPLIEKIKTRIRKEIGEYITVSCGISHNKLLAKLASGLKKPNGVMEIKEEDLEKVYKYSKLTDICGIGERIKERLNYLGIYSFLELRKFPFSILVKEFGEKEAEFLKKVSFGIDDDQVIPYTDTVSVKSISRNYCLPHNEYNKRVVLQNIYELSEEVSIKLRRLKKTAKTVGLSLRGFRNWHERETLGCYIDSGKDIFEVCKKLCLKWGWTKASIQESMVRMISVSLSSLEDKENIQLSLFDNTIKKDSLIKTIDRINEKFGDHTIRNAFLLYSNKLTTVPNGYLADRLERKKLSEII